jgi:hypothetical protein
MGKAPPEELGDPRLLHVHGLAHQGRWSQPVIAGFKRPPCWSVSPFDTVIVVARWYGRGATLVRRGASLAHRADPWRGRVAWTIRKHGRPNR